MEDVIGRLIDETGRGNAVALASLVWSTGSIPMSDSAKMLVTERGEIVGTIGGGCLEAEVYTAGQSVLQSNTPCDMRYTMTEKQAGENGLNCGGTVRIYTERIDAVGGGEAYAEIEKAKARRAARILITELNGQRRFLTDEQGNILWSIGDCPLQVRELLRGVKFKNKGGGLILRLPDVEEEFFVEPFWPQPRAYVFGGGHVGGQVAALAKNVGFYVVLIDDRPFFANEERHPYADECIAGEIESVFLSLSLDQHSYVLALTRGHQYDEQVVECALDTQAGYIGMLGSERKKIVLWKKILQRGADPERLGKVFSPIGVNIGADTPEEIAVSVVAEMVRVRRGVRKEWKTKKAEGMQ